MKQRLDILAEVLLRFSRVAVVGLLLAGALVWLGWLPDYVMLAAGAVLIVVVMAGWLVAAARMLLGR